MDSLFHGDVVLTTNISCVLPQEVFILVQQSNLKDARFRILVRPDPKPQQTFGVV